MTSAQNLLGLDVGAKRIGIARADTSTKLAFPLTTLEVNGNELAELTRLVKEVEPVAIVVGHPRNQTGEPTAQTAEVIKFSQHLEAFGVPVVFQDESLTSVIAEERLLARGKVYDKASIDAEAAAIILQDYIEEKYGH